MHFRFAQANCPEGHIGSSVESNGFGVLASIIKYRQIRNQFEQIKQSITV